MGILRGRRSCRRRHCSRRRPLHSRPPDASLGFNPGEPMPQVLFPVLPGLVLEMPPVAPVLPLPPPALPPLVPAPIGPPLQVRQNYHRFCELAVNRLIYLELHASYVYLGLAFHNYPEDLALKHFAPFFLWKSREAQEKAEMLMRLQNLRGGRIRLRNIRKPECSSLENGLTALKSALHLDRSLNQCLLNVCQLASQRRDPHLSSYLKRNFLHKQVKSIKVLGGIINQLSQVGSPESGLADYLFDKLTLGDSDENN